MRPEDVTCRFQQGEAEFMRQTRLAYSQDVALACELMELILCVLLGSLILGDIGCLALLNFIIVLNVLFEIESLHMNALANLILGAVVVGPVDQSLLVDVVNVNLQHALARHTLQEALLDLNVNLGLGEILLLADN